MLNCNLKDIKDFEALLLRVKGNLPLIQLRRLPATVKPVTEKITPKEMTNQEGDGYIDTTERINISKLLPCR